MKHIYLTLTLLLFFSINIQSQILSQDFEGATMVMDPALGWSQSSIAAPSYGWFYDTPTAFIITGTRSAVTYGSNDDWLISPGFVLTSGQQVEIKFNYRTNSNTPTETADVSVYIATDNTPNMATTGSVLLQDPVINSPSPSAFSDVFTAPADGTYHIGYHSITTANASFTIDDVVVDAPLSVAEYSKPNISIFPNPAKTEINILGGAVKKVQIFSILGNKLIDATSNVVNLEELSSGVYIVKIELKDGGSITKKLIAE